MSYTKKTALIGMLSAFAFAVNLAFPRITIVPAPFPLYYDAKDVVIVIGGFLLGPLSAFIIASVTAVIEMVTISQTGPFGLIMNIISSSAFACTASAVYYRNRRRPVLFASLLLSCIAMTGVMLLWNYIIVPLYNENITRAAVQGMLISVFLPFNLIKSALNAGLTLVLFAPLAAALGKAQLISEPGGHSSGGFNPGALLAGLFVIITCILTVLALRG